MASITVAKGRKLTFPSVPGVPKPSAVFSEAIELAWTAPGSAGGTGIQGYRVDIRTGGDGDFLVAIAHTNDAEPCCTLQSLTPMTWYEFRVAAINAVAAGLSSPACDPILTRPMAGMATHNATGATGRRRRTKQQGGALLAAERAAHAQAMAREERLAADLRRSIASVDAWSDVFRVRHGRTPRADDRDASRVLREEAHSQISLRYSLAEAAIVSLDAEAAVLLKEAAVAKAAMRRWERTLSALTSAPPTDAEKGDDPKYASLAERRDGCAQQLVRLERRRKRAVAKLEAARAELGSAASEMTADASLVEAAAAAERRRGADGAGANGTDGAGDAGGGGGGGAAADGSRGGRVERRWTQGLKQGVAEREALYLELCLERVASRELSDAISGMSRTQLRKAVTEFGAADEDTDGCLSLPEFQAHLVGRHGERYRSDILFGALVKRVDLDRNGVIDFNEWLVYSRRHAQRGRAAEGGGEEGEASEASEADEDDGEEEDDEDDEAVVAAAAAAAAHAAHAAAAANAAHAARSSSAAASRALVPATGGGGSPAGPATVPQEYFLTLREYASSRERQDELPSPRPRPEEEDVVAAAVAFSAIDHDRNVRTQAARTPDWRIRPVPGTRRRLGHWTGRLAEAPHPPCPPSPPPPLAPPGPPTVYARLCGPWSLYGCLWCGWAGLPLSGRVRAALDGLRDVGGECGGRRPVAKEGGAHVREGRLQPRRPRRFQRIPRDAPQDPEVAHAASGRRPRRVAIAARPRPPSPSPTRLDGSSGARPSQCCQARSEGEEEGQGQLWPADPAGRARRPPPRGHREPRERRRARRRGRRGQRGRGRGGGGLVGAGCAREAARGRGAPTRGERAPRARHRRALRRDRRPRRPERRRADRLRIRT